MTTVRDNAIESFLCCVIHVDVVVVLIRNVEVPSWMVVTMALSCVGALAAAIGSCVTLITNRSMPREARCCCVAACLGSLFIACCGVCLTLAAEMALCLSAPVCSWAVLEAYVWISQQHITSGHHYATIEKAAAAGATSCSDCAVVFV